MKKTYDLAEVSQLSRVSEELIIRFVSCSWVRPAGEDETFFDSEDIARIRLIHDLQTSLGVNDEAVPIVLHLVDQLNRLHRELKGNIE